MKSYITALVAAAVAIAFTPTSASAGHYFHPIIHHVTAPKAPPPSIPKEGQKWSCWMNPAASLICVVIVGIVVDEVKRSIDGPACATGKLTRKSWFGMVVDEPRLWRPLCDWKDPISVRG